MKKLDLVVIALVALLSLLPLAAALPGRTDGEAVVIVTQRGAVLYEGPLGTDAVVTTPDGGNIIEIKGGQARMHAADCPDRLCMQSGAATALRPLVCLPNEVTVAVTGGEEAQLDAITQ